jgi:hypothetical protein
MVDRDGNALYRAKSVETMVQPHVDKWMDYEREHVLPCFEVAKSIGFDLPKAVDANPGKNCTTLLIEHLLVPYDEYRREYDAAVHVAAHEIWAAIKWGRFRDDERTLDYLDLLGDHRVTPEVVHSWTDRQCDLVERWAITSHFRASDNDVDAMSVPEFLKEFL